METLQPNKNKNLIIDVDGARYARMPVKTHVVLAKDELKTILSQYLKPHLAAGDMIFISEKIVAITQGRSFPIKDIKPSALAKILVKFVHKTPSGIGIGSPWTMELAIREAGVAKIILAALIAAITKPLGIKGMFYKIAGKEIAAIDGPCDYTLPPYNEYAKLGPKNPGAVAEFLKGKIGYDVVIIDANDLGVSVLGKSNKNISDDFAKKVFRDNPLGQTNEQTPLCIVRKIDK
ncbi:coenzyme F420-0:L-glutamate ligase [Patescibacteria group bacterium]|nr:coenzyme F420-0:L-glutamate ligase [Patescibacteria group bacterium]MBU4338016.1 coenzyme F420-0:L-glutamate ligase [Patescibacteria group bacterium]MBU4580399.1 coenzyme F420-0:L-glutamate ligase [Patescibacteria group bacterium]